MTHGTVNQGTRGLAVGGEPAAGDLLEAVRAEVESVSELAPALSAISELRRFNASDPPAWSAGPLADHRAAVVVRLAQRVLDGIELLPHLALSPRAARWFALDAFGYVRVALEIAGRPRTPSRHTTPAQRLDPKGGPE